MATYLYCVRSDPSSPPSGLAGIDGAAVRDLEAGGLTVWVSEIDGVASPTVDRVKAHDAVCAAALDSGETPLPIRFGQVFSDDSAAIAAIASRRSALSGRLSRIANCVELRVVVTRGREAHADTTEEDERDVAQPVVSGDESVAELEGPGTAFLRRLARAGRADLAREVGCEEIRHAVRTRAKSLIVDEQRCESARGLAFFPVLVRRRNVEAFRSAMVESLAPQAIGLSVLGPFAPYSFASDA